MEIISYLKGKKAQAALKELHEVVGQDGFMHGSKDVVDVYAGAHERISALETSNKDRELSTKVEDITKKVALELMNQKLRAETLIHAKRYDHTNLLFDSFETNAEMDTTHSVNVAHEVATQSIKQIDPTKPGEYVTVITEKPIHLFWMNINITDQNQLSIILDQNDIEQLYRTEIVGGQFKILKNPNGNTDKVYYEFGEVIFKESLVSDPIEIDKTYYNTNFSLTHEVQVFIRQQKDGAWGNFEPIATISKITDIFQIKIRFYATKQYYDYETAFTETSLTKGVVRDGDYFVDNNIFRYPMVSDATWTDLGTVTVFEIKRSEFNRIDKLEVY